MKTKKLYVGLLLVAMLVPCIGISGTERKKDTKKNEKTDTTKKKVNTYDKLLKKPGVVTAKGEFVTIHKIDKKVYLEYPLKHLGRRILIGRTVSSVSNPTFVNVGYKYADPLHLQVELQDSSVIFNRPNTSATLNSNDPGLRAAFEKNYTPKLYKRFPIAAYTPDSTAVVFDITAMVFEMGPHNNNLVPPKEGSKEEKEKTSLGKIKSFTDNASVEISQEIEVMQQVLIFRFKLGEVSTTSNVSILLLPEKQMSPRIQDSRVGVFWSMDANSKTSTSKHEISTIEDGMRPYILANRWRLEPTDMAAWKKGQTVEVKKPIVWYVDNTFPAEWKSSIRQGVLVWNKAFEKIGLKNVMQVQDFPTEEEDPAFDPDNLKYSCIRYSPSATMNAMGPSWVDPVTGEILNASVIVYNDIIKLINNWRFVQTAQVDERVRSKKMPKDVVDESMVYVIAHEIGHTLGLMHNMGASSAFPVDSLRSVSFTQKYGTTPSIMDYARHNYVAQPEDKGVKLTPPDLGVYDEYVIQWLYTPVPEAKDMWEEAEIASRLIDEKAGDPFYRYGRQQIQSQGFGQYDPSALMEDLGDDPIKAGNYGIKNLKYILPRMNEWIESDEDTRHRQSLYTQIVNQYYRYLTNALYQIGGIYLTEVKDGTSGNPVIPVDRERQKSSLFWVLKELRSCDWINNPELTNKFPLHTKMSSKICALVASNLLTTIPTNVTLSAHVAQEKNAYTIQEYFNDLYNEVFSSTLRDRKLTNEEKILQRSIVTAMAKPMIAEKNAQKITADPIVTIEPSLPSLEELRFLGLIHPVLLDRFETQLEYLEEKFGKGAVASALLTEQFGESRFPFQKAVKVNDISEIDIYKQNMVDKINKLLKNKRTNAHADDKAHYEYLWRQTRNALDVN